MKFYQFHIKFNRQFIIKTKLHARLILAYGFVILHQNVFTVINNNNPQYNIEIHIILYYDGSNVHYFDLLIRVHSEIQIIIFIKTMFIKNFIKSYK